MAREGGPSQTRVLALESLSPKATLNGCVDIRDKWSLTFDGTYLVLKVYGKLCALFGHFNLLSKLILLWNQSQE